MKFLQYQNSDVWWEWPEGGMTVFNMNGGHHDIDENSEEFMYGKVIEAEDWPDLCRKMKYNPWKVEQPTREMWISPDGTMHDCGEWGAHEITAEHILENLLGEKVRFWDAGDSLHRLGWIKVTANRIMYQYYCDTGLYDSMTDEQWAAVEKWKERWL